MRKKQLLQILQEQEDKIKHLEECLSTQDNLLDEYHSREAMTVTALENAQNKAEEILESAEKRARTIVENAENKRNSLLQDAESTVKDYREMLDRYNDLLERSAKQAQEGAELYASFVRSQSVTDAKLENNSQEPAPAEEPVQENGMPDPAGDPSQLMKNIYKLQDRDIPESVQSPVKESSEYTEEKQSRDVESILEEVLFKSQEEPLKNEKVERVSDFVQDKKEDDVPLDDLLDEIISAGEKEGNK